MKKIFMLSILFFAIMEVAFCDQIELIRDELFVTKISNTLYIATHYFPWESNSLIVKTDKEKIIFIDTPYTNEATEVLYNWIVKDNSSSDIKAIVTGYHIDNIGGVEFLKSKNIEVTGSKLTNQLVESNGSGTLLILSNWLNRSTQSKYINYYSTAKMVKTNREIDIKNLNIYQFDNVKLELFYPGESHAKDNLTVYIESENTLFGSCIIKSMESRNLGFTGDANMKNWPNAVKLIKERYKDVSLVIPHHGKWGGPELFDHTLGLF